MKRGGATLAALLLAGCAAAPAPRPPASAELHRYCAGLMYSMRGGQGRTAPNWFVYDRCVREHAAR